MLKALTLAAAAFAMASCASTEMKTFIGKPAEEAMFAYGPPANVFDLSDGRRAYQYRWGGGAVMMPGRATSTAQSFGSITTVQTTATPAAIFESAGCLITFIARDQGGGRWVLEDYRVPKQLVC